MGPSPGPDCSTIHGLFAAQAARHPEAIAVEDGEHALTYAELDARADRLAQRLVRLGVGTEARVAVLQRRSSALVVSLLAVLKAGAAYVPLHTGYPPARHALVTADSGAGVLLVDKSFAPVGFDHAARTVVVDEDPASAPVPHPAMAPAPAPAERGNGRGGLSLAYVMHTSGTTDAPKCVAVTHEAVLGLVTDASWADGAHRAVLFHAPYAFDVSTYEVWVPLLTGGRIVVAPDEPLDGALLHTLLTRHGVTAVHVTAGLFAALANDTPQAFASVREVLTGGDVVPTQAVNRVLAACPGVRIRHLYGPTETTLFATHLVVEKPLDDGRPLPLGRPRGGTRAYVLDGRLAPVAEGETGELYVAGHGVARGYLDRPGPTAERFLADPYGPPGERMYRTGDLVRLGAGSALEFLGRGDGQVKIRGFRVELGEVEAALGRQPGIGRAVVTASREQDGTVRLVAYVVPEPERGPGEPATVREPAALREPASPPGPGVPSEPVILERLGGVLPAYMVPAAVVVLAALPLTPNGKVDRDALPAPRRAPAGGRGRPPRTEREKKLCALFATVLDVPEVSVDDSFLDLGGDSLRAFRLVRLITSHFGVRPSLRQVLRTPTVAGLDAWLEGRG
ncbi:non-ribosomal peptide synthetase [Streptomyces varsoviensis]|nr:non-ribosomal peptide synthetase [Streptomyces varsoviensis]